MARRSYELRLGDKVFKLRLTLAGQKHLLEKNPGTPIMAIVMSAVDDPEDMENLLTEALNWDGNENTIKTGAELYDMMVDSGYCGSKAFMRVVLDIAHNAGLIDESDRQKVERGVTRQLDTTFDLLAGDDQTPGDTVSNEEGGESSDNPTMTTLDG